MKKQIIFLVLCFELLFTMSAISQPVYNNAYSEIFFGRQPSARAEALGRSYVAMHGDIMTTFYNPAGLTSLQGVSASASYASPYYTPGTSYNYLGASYSVADLGVIAFSRYQFQQGETEIISGNATVIGTVDPTTSVYTVSLASKILTNFSAGINFNLLRYANNVSGIVNHLVPESESFYVDLGFQHRLPHSVTEKLHGELTMGASLLNANTATTGRETNSAMPKGRLPVQLHLGAAYNVSFHGTPDISDLTTIQLRAQIAYQDVLNSKFFNGTHFGLEFGFLEIAFLRFGYYHQYITDDTRYVYSDSFDELTYGFGIRIPVEKITKGSIPMQFRFDITSLPQPTIWDFVYTYNIGNFTIYALQCDLRL